MPNDHLQDAVDACNRSSPVDRQHPAAKNPELTL